MYISIFPGEVTNTRVNSNYSLDDEINHFSTIIMGTFFTLVFMFWLVVEILEKVIQRIYPIALPIYILIIGAVMLGIVCIVMQTLDFLDTFLKPQEESYDTAPDNIESIPEFAVDRIPSTKWWDDRAPVVLVSLLRTLTKVIMLNCRIITISKTLAVGIALSLIGATIFVLAGVGIVPPLYAACIGFAIAILGFIITIKNSLGTCLENPLSTAVGVAFSLSMFSITLVNLLRQL